MIIDAHCHVGEYIRHFSEPFATEMMSSIGLPPQSITIDVPTLLGEMDAAGIDRAFVLAFDAYRTLGVRVPNEYVASICHAYPDRCIGFGSVDGCDPKAGERVQYCAQELGLRGIKIAPAYLRLSIADRSWGPVYEAAERLGLPVLAHTGFTPAKGAAQQFFSPMLADAVAASFPRLRLILAHLGAPWAMQCIDLLAKHPNLYADLSIVGWYQPIERVAMLLSMARERRVLERLLWGTDHPWGPHQAFRARMERLATDAALFPDGRALTEAEWTSIMGAAALGLVGG